MQSWKCSDWMVSWIRWFSCGPTWTDGAEVEEDASFKPSSTFLMLNFFIFQSAEHRIKGGWPLFSHSVVHTHTHAQRRALRPPVCGSHVSASPSARSPSLGGCDARLVDARGWTGGGWDGSILGRRSDSLLRVSVAPLLASASLPSPPSPG